MISTPTSKETSAFCEIVRACVVWAGNVAAGMRLSSFDFRWCRHFVEKDTPWLKLRRTFRILGERPVEEMSPCRRAVPVFEI